MKQLLIEIDDETARRLEAVAPGKSRMRSRFIREAIRRSLDALTEERMAQAYMSEPDEEPEHVDPAVWEPGEAKRHKRR